MKKIVSILPVVAIVVAIIAAIAVAGMQPSRKQTMPAGPPPVSQFSHAVAAVGLIESSSENIRIGSHLSGIVEQVDVRAGDDVAQGAPLFRLETRHLRAQLADANAALDVKKTGVSVAEANAGDAREQLDLVLAVNDKRAVSEDDVQRRRFALKTAEAKLEQARADVKAAEAERERVQVEIDRSTVLAPIAGSILKVNVHTGEFASAGEHAEPLIILGSVKPLYVRVDVDEHEAARVRPDAPATAALRGDAAIRSPLKFVRIEPLVIPKKSLTGDSSERVDTRVMQVLYEIQTSDPRFFVGQQMDVFIEGRS